MFLRASILRAVAGLSATALTSAALVFGGATAAVAASSLSCPEAASTRLFTANDGQYKVWLYQPTANEAHICFAATFFASVAGDIIVRGALNGPVVPTVTPLFNGCDEFLHIQDPVDFTFLLEADAGNPGRVCVGVGSTAVGVSFTYPGVPSADPEIEVWLDPQTTVGSLYCTWALNGSSEYCFANENPYQVIDTGRLDLD